ncbi:MAG: Calx-beta domain-containing protein [Panacagrimonas sp.]
MNFPLHYDLSPIPRLGRLLGRLGLMAGALAVAGPAAAQVVESSIIEQPPPADSGREFSIARATSVDGNTLIVGDMLADSASGASTDQGEVYIYVRNPANPTAYSLVKTLVAPDAAQDDRFGTSVAVSGDLAVVGAEGTDVGGSRSGSVYIFYRNVGGPNNWGFVTKIAASDAAADDIFGGAGVTVSDNARSNDVIAVAATGNDNEKGTNAGAVYIFQRDQGGSNAWGQVRKILPPPGMFRDRLMGRGLILQGDRLVIGSGGEKVFIFERNEGGPEAWGNVATLEASDRTAGDQFGEFSVDLDGDLVVVGARADNNERGQAAGAAYVFQRNAAGDWLQTQKIIGADSGPAWTFGTDVAVEGDLLIVGMQARDRLDRRIGATYAYRPSGVSGRFQEVARLVPSVRDVASGFGRSVELAEGIPLVGAPADDNTTGRLAGAVFVYDLAGAQDFGDAPAPYPTALAANGASHTVTPSSFSLGAAADVEDNGVPSANANSDDRAGDDEDGVSFSGALVAGATTGLSVTLTGPNGSGDQGLLSGWVDFNRDGDWSDAGEFVFQNVTLTNGVNALSLPIPLAAVPGTTFARFRLSSAGVGVPTGPANDGEVEDYLVTLMPVPVVAVLNIRPGLQVIEGNSGTLSTVLTVTLSEAVTSEVRVNYSTADGTALAADGDYAATSGVLVIPAGTTRASFTLVVNGDTRTEADETFSVVLSNPVNATIANSTTSVRIRNDDLLSVSFLSAGVGMVEGDRRVATIRLSGPSTRRVVVPITVTGRATSGADYQVLRTEVIFSPGSTERRLPIQSIDDSVSEPNEDLILTLDESASYTLGAQSQTRFVIRDNDLVSVGFTSAGAGVEEGRRRVVTVRLSGPSEGRIVVPFTITGRATSDADYEGLRTVVAFNPGVTERRIVIQSIDDSVVETNEVLILTLGESRGYSLGAQSQARIVIRDND